MSTLGELGPDAEKVLTFLDKHACFYPPSLYTKGAYARLLRCIIFFELCRYNFIGWDAALTGSMAVPDSLLPLPIPLHRRVILHDPGAYDRNARHNYDPSH
eukprot:g9414.t1